MTLQEYNKLFGGHPAPVLLTDLWSFVQQHPNFAEGFDLITNTDFTWSLLGQRPCFSQRILPFAQADSNGSIYALWQQENADLNQAPIVVFSDDEGAHVVASHLTDLLLLLSLDVEPIIDEDGAFYCKDEENYEPSPCTRIFRKWLRARFQLCPISTNFEAEQIVETAQLTYAQPFDKWLQYCLTPSSPTLHLYN